MKKENKLCKGLERRIGYRFRRRGLLTTALTHPSFVAESDDADESNQRLEFLGDAVLDFLLAGALFDRFPDEPEGVLTSLRSQLSSGRALADRARELDLGACLLMGKGEETSGGRTRSTTLADAIEAVLGAVYVDGGCRAASRVFKRIFRESLDSLTGDVWAHNPKGRLQELIQQRWKEAPVYQLVHKEGPAHAARFHVAVSVNGKRIGKGSGTSKQAAEQRAAASALEGLKEAEPGRRES